MNGDDMEVWKVLIKKRKENRLIAVNNNSNN